MSIPSGIDPLVDLPEGIEDQPLAAQLEVLRETYGPEVIYGLGLELIVENSGRESWEFRLAEETARRLRAIDEQEELGVLAERAREAYQGRQQQIIWAAEALGIEAQPLLRYLRAGATDRYNYEAPLICAAPDPDLDLQLKLRHGPTPEWFDPSHQGQTEGLSEDQALEFLARTYGPAQARAQALEELLARVKSPAADRLARELIGRRGQGATTAEVFRQELQEVIALEAQCLWTAEHLGLSPSQVLEFIDQRC